MPIYLCQQSPYEVADADALMPVVGWNNFISIGGLSTDNAAETGHPISNVADSNTNLRWRSSSLVSDAVTIVSALTEEEIDYVALAGHNLGSQGIPITVKLASTSSSGYLTIFGPTTLDDDSPVIFRWHPSTTYQVRLEFGTGSDSVEVGVIYLGKLTEFQRSIKVTVKHTPFNLGQRAKLIMPKQENGSFPGRVRLGRSSVSTLEFEHVDQYWFRTHLQPVIEGMQEDPFFVAWDSAEYPEDAGFAWVLDDPVPEIDPVTRLVAVSLKMEGFLS